MYIRNTVYVEIYAGTFFRGFEGAHVYVCTYIRGSDPDYLPLFFYNRLNSVEIYLRWYLHLLSEHDLVNSGDYYTANISTYTV